MKPSPSRSTRTTVAPALAILRVYLRQSIGEDRNTHGIPAQRAICERFALKIDPSGALWATRKEYVDVGFSRDDLSRPQYLSLLTEAATGDTVLIWDRSRLGVDLDYAVAVRELIQRRSARVIVASTGETIDMSGEFSPIVEALHGASGGGELRRTRRLTREKLRERVLKGYLGGPLPYGYEIYPEHPEDPESLKLGRVVPAEAAVIVRIVTMYAEGAGWDRLSRTLNREGIPSPGAGRSRNGKALSGEWSRAQLWDVMHNQTYRGAYVFGTRGGKGGKFPPISVPHPEWKIGTDELWAKAETAHAARTTDMRACLNATKHTLSGVALCGACGGGVSVQVDGRPGKKVKNYTCSRSRYHRTGKCDARFRIRAEMLEGAIKDALGEWFDATHGAVRAAVAEARIAAMGAPDVAGAKQELATAQAEQARLVRLAMATDGAVDAITDALTVGQAKVKRLEAALAQATAPRADARLIGRQIEREAIQRLDALRAALSGPDARDALHSLFPGGISLRLTEGAYEVEGEGVLLTGQHPSGNRTVVRNPDEASGVISMISTT